MRDFVKEFKEAVRNILKEEDEDITLEKAKEQVEAWKERIYREEYADDFYYSNGGYSHDSAQLRYWQDKVRELERAARTPEENARLDAEEEEKRKAEIERSRKAAEEWEKEQYNVPDVPHYYVGDRFMDPETQRVFEIDEVEKGWIPNGRYAPKMTPYYTYGYHCLDLQYKDVLGRSHWKAESDHINRFYKSLSTKR